MSHMHQSNYAVTINHDCNENIRGLIVVLFIQDRTFSWPMKKHYSLYVQKKKEQDHSHTKEPEQYHVQLQEYSHPSNIFGIHHAV